MIPRVIALTGVLGAAFATAASAADGVASGDTSKAKIALSNSYAGNTWRQQMLKTWDAATKDAQGKKLIADSKVVNSNNSAPEQATQIQNLILQGYDAIVINAASPDGAERRDQGGLRRRIIVVVFDGIVTEPCAYRVAFDFKEMGKQEVDLVAKKLGGKGNLLEIRGLAGISVDDAISKGIHEGVAKDPASRSSARSTATGTRPWRRRRSRASCRRLPEIVAIVDQGGDGYGAAQAFKAAGRPIPIIIMGNRQDELALVEGAEGAGRLRDVVALDRARRVLDRLLGGAAGPGRQGGAERPSGAALVIDEKDLPSG